MIFLLQKVNIQELITYIKKITLAVFALADDISRFGLAIPALANSRRVVAIDKAVFLDAANRHLDDAMFVLADDRLLGNDIADVVAYRFADFLPVAQPVLPTMP